MVFFSKREEERDTKKWHTILYAPNKSVTQKRARVVSKTLFDIFFVFFWDRTMDFETKKKLFVRVWSPKSL